jgi:hypothetical protein
MTEPFSVHDQPGFERTYDEDETVPVRKGDLRAVLDVATQSLDFGSGFLDNEQVEVLRKLAVMLDIDPMLATPYNFRFQYGCKAAGHHTWEPYPIAWAPGVIRWTCSVCSASSFDVEPPDGV